MKYFTLSELSHSSTAQRLGLNNTPGPQEREALTVLVEKLLDPLREKYGAAIIVSSGYRCPSLNKAVGGAPSSQHIKGQAADIESVTRTRAENMKLFNTLLASGLPFDQVINEFDYSWIHVSFNPEHNRGQVLRSFKENGRTVYENV